jgi:hypothetical protein
MLSIAQDVGLGLIRCEHPPVSVQSSETAVNEHVTVARKCSVNAFCLCNPRRKALSEYAINTPFRNFKQEWTTDHQ